MKYLPPFDLIRRMVEVSTVRGELRVSLSYDDFVKILRMMISGIEVDEAWYLKEYEDIAQAIAKRQRGIGEAALRGRRLFRGQAAVPDAGRRTVLSGTQCRCRGERAQGRRRVRREQHFVEDGYREGRLPREL